MLNSKQTKGDLLVVFKSLLEEESLGSQRELSTEMSNRGFANISQTKTSRLLTKLGAIKRRNKCNKLVYKLPGIYLVPNKKQKIHSIILNVQHNNVQIVVKTIAGGGNLISKMIESMPNNMGIIGCIASNDTIFVIPNNIKNINRTTQMLINNLQFNIDYSEK